MEPTGAANKSRPPARELSPKALDSYVPPAVRNCEVFEHPEKSWFSFDLLAIHNDFGR
jgi:hypothetical protein